MHSALLEKYLPAGVHPNSFPAFVSALQAGSARLCLLRFRLLCMNPKRTVMKKRCHECFKDSSLFKLNASQQVSVSILLLTVIPSLVSFLSGRYMAGEGASLPYAALLGLLTVALVAAGYRIYKKYPDNIVQLRALVTELTEGYIPEHVVLQRAYESNDLLYIEQRFNILIQEMKRRQQESIRQECRRTMIESVSILVGKLSRPLDVIRKNLMHLDVIAPMDEEHVNIARCLKEVAHIKKDIGKIMKSRELRECSAPFEGVAGPVASLHGINTDGKRTGSYESKAVDSFPAEKRDLAVA